MPVPINYRKSPDAVASYDFLDVTSGCGYRRYYGACALIVAAAHVYMLTTRVLDSDTGRNVTTTGIWTDATAPTTLDIDFDITFGVPATTATADAFVNVPIYLPDAASCTTTATIYHVRAGFETSLGSTISSAIDFAANTYMNTLLKVALTRHSFAIGDTLRLNLSFSLSGTGAFRVYHDPSSALTFTDGCGRVIGTDLTVEIPFEVNI